MPCTDKSCEQALKKTKMCAYFRKGRCSRGADCTFAHSPQELNDRPNLSKTRFCIPFQHSGTCSMGLACRFAHEERELRPIAKKNNERLEPENRPSIQAARMPQQPKGTPYHQQPQPFFHQGGMDEYAELEVDRDTFSRQSSQVTTFEDCMSNFSRQTSINMEPGAINNGIPGYYRQTSPFVPTLATISRQQPVVHQSGRAHSPGSSSQDSAVFYKSEDSEGQRIIRLMEHLIDSEVDDQHQSRLTKMDVYHNQAQNGTPHQRRLWDDLMGNNDGDDDALDGNWGGFSKLNNSGQQDWRTIAPITWFNDSEGGGQDKCAEGQYYKSENSDGDYSQYYNPMATHGAENGREEEWQSATKVGDSCGGYSQYDSPKRSPNHGRVLMFGGADLNCNVQNTFLHFSSDSGEQKQLRRSNSLSALPLRGL